MIVRNLILPIVLGAAIMLVTIGAYWALEALLVGYADYDRGLWQGASLVLVMSGGNTMANYVLKRVDARKTKRA